MGLQRILATVFALGMLALLAPAGRVEAGLLPSDEPDFSLEGEPCELIEVPAAAPVGTGSCPGVRPGALVETDAGFCTFNFLFTGSDGRRYIGTAGHCIVDDGEERSWGSGGPVARDGDGNRIGEFAYAILDDPKDFALIRIDADVPANPAMCHFGGPTGTNADTTSDPVVLHHFGQGVGLGTVLPGRTAVAATMPSPDSAFAAGAVVPGDSGSGVISADGRAVGVAVTVGVHLGSSDGTPHAGAMGITRLAPQVARAEQVLGTNLTLQTAPLAP